MDWAKKLKKILRNQKKLTINVTGKSWGLASNCIHYFDLVSWWTNENLKKINTRDLNRFWFESKRKGFYDINGKIQTEFTNGTILNLDSNIHGNDVVMEIVNKDGLIWEVNQILKLIKYPDKSILDIDMPFQSMLTPNIVDNIINYGKCELPTLDENFLSNKILLKSFLSHWNQNKIKKTTILPIT